MWYDVLCVLCCLLLLFFCCLVLCLRLLFVFCCLLGFPCLVLKDEFAVALFCVVLSVLLICLGLFVLCGV